VVHFASLDAEEAAARERDQVPENDQL